METAINYQKSDSLGSWFMRILNELIEQSFALSSINTEEEYKKYFKKYAESKVEHGYPEQDRYALISTMNDYLEDEDKWNQIWFILQTLSNISEQVDLD